MFFKIDSVLRDAKGNWTYNVGAPKREAYNQLGPEHCRLHGEGSGPIHVEGDITDQRDLVSWPTS